MTNEAPGEPVPSAERWVFGGSRVQDGKRVHCWIDPDGQALLYKARGGFTVGSIYEAKVLRHGDGGITKYGNPQYTGDRADAELLDELVTLHRAAEVTLDLAARERADKRDDPLERAIERLCELAATVPASQRTGLAVYVTTRLMRARR